MSLKRVPTLEQITQEHQDIDALIFDMDGTLINSEILHAKALAQLLHEVGAQNVNFKQLLLKFKGVSEPDVLDMLIQMNILDKTVDLEEFIQKKNHYFTSFLTKKEMKRQLVHPEIIYLLEQAKNQGFKLAIVTASERTTTDLFLGHLGLKDFFDFIITRDDTKMTKPHPMPYLHSFEKLMVKAISALIFEDSDTGHTAAKASGAKVQRVCWYD